MAEDFSEMKDNLEIGGKKQGNYTQFEPTGFRSSRGRAIAYRDEYPSHTWMTPVGANSPDQANHTIGGVARRVYCFDGTTTLEELSSSFEVPHDYAYGQPIEMHAHIRPATSGSGTIKLNVDWEYSPPQGAPTQHTTKSTLSFEVAVDDQQYYNLICSFDEDLGTDEMDFELGGKIGFRVYRDPGDAADTYAADMILEQVALHVPVDSDGSHEPYVK